MSTTTPNGARARPWAFLRDLKVPTDDQQRQMTLECAQARVLHRVALLRGPVLPPPLVERLVALHIRIRVPVRPRQLVPTALALCHDDPDGAVCQASIEWIDREIQLRNADLQPFLDHVLASQARWHRARRAVVRSNLKLALSVVLRRFSRSAMAHEDLFQEAVFGLAKAADRFDTTLGVKFSTYATWWIRHSIQRAIVNSMRLVRIPSHVCDSLFRYSHAVAALGDEADDEAIAARAQITVKQVGLLRELRVSQIPISLDAPAYDDDDVPLGERLETQAAAPDLALRERDREIFVRRLLEHLSERSRCILSKRYGIGDVEPVTLKEIGEQLRLSRERVRQIQGTALATLNVRAARAQCTTSQV